MLENDTRCGGKKYTAWSGTLGGERMEGGSF